MTGAPAKTRQQRVDAGGARPVALSAGFTLTELLIVVGIIVLVAAIAVPSFRAITGSRSTEAAENQISAVIARARTEALGLQEPRGVLFYRDLDTRRVGMAIVFPTNTGAPWELDMVADRDVTLLPRGVGVQFVDDDATASAIDDDRYIGFNTRVVRNGALTPPAATEVPFGGVVLFDAQGRLISDPVAFRRTYPTAVPVRASDLGRFLYNNPTLPTGGPDVVFPVIFSKIGFVLFDEEEFAGVYREGRDAGTTEDQDFQHDDRVTFGTLTPGTVNEAAEENWLDNNAKPVLINRYNGTLLSGE